MSTKLLITNQADPKHNGVRVISSCGDWLRLFGHAIGAPPREMWPKYGKWYRQQHEPIRLTDEQLREWRAGR